MVVPGKASDVKMVGWQGGGTNQSRWVAVHLDCWCVCLCYVHFAPENPEDGEQRYDIWVSPVAPHMPTQTGGGNVKFIPNEECVPKHKLLLMDMQFNTTKRWRIRSLNHE